MTANTAMHRKVSILLFRMFHYRVDFLNLLTEELLKHDIALEVFYGKPTPESLAKNDTGFMPGSVEIASWCVRLGGKEILLQIPPRRVYHSDLIICMQENRLLINYVMQLYTRLVPNVRFAFWGHGRNFQSRHSTGVREALKRFLLRGSDWFFAYTEASRASLLASGYKADSITVFNNTIDTRTFTSAVEKTTHAQRLQFLEELGIPEQANVGLFCGSMYPAKRIEELLQACKLIKAQVPDFQLICLGDGPSAELIKNAQTTDVWVHFLGVQTGQQKALAYAVSRVVLNPGLVGLHVVDSFSAGVPMLTMEYEFHSPEFAYLESGVNGLVTEADVGAYASAAVTLLTDSTAQEKLAAGARQAADQYSLQVMVSAYAEGVVNAIQR